MSNRLTKGKARVGSLVVDTSGGVGFGTDGVVAERKIKALAFSGLATSEQASGWFLPTYSLVHDMWVKVTTASSASGTINVGLISTTSGDADGFIVSLGTSTTGLFYPTVAYTAATSGDVVSGTNGGALWTAMATGTTDLGSWGYYTKIPYRSNASLETQVSWTLNSTSGTAGYLYVEYTEI